MTPSGGSHDGLVRVLGCSRWRPIITCSRFLLRYVYLLFFSWISHLQYIVIGDTGVGTAQNDYQV